MSDLPAFSLLHEATLRRVLDSVGRPMVNNRFLVALKKAGLVEDDPAVVGGYVVTDSGHEWLATHVRLL